MKIVLPLLFTLLSFESFSQEKPILVFDLINGTLDSIPVVIYDTNVVRDKTNHSLGSFNSSIENLEQTPPTVNTVPSTNFTYKKRASIDYDLTNYPLRTIVKLFRVEDGASLDLCSGTLISERHVLTAAHCVSVYGQNSLFVDSLMIYPAFDNGVDNTNFNSSPVSKVYVFRNWSFSGEDLAILELEQTIGEETGYVGIGFDNLNDSLSDGIFYKFSYPYETDTLLDPNTYNGDTMYYNYGNINLVTDISIGVIGATGIPGESGSSLIKIKNGDSYTAYGALTFVNNITHSKINDWQFYAFKEIIEDDLVEISLASINQRIKIYPNPVKDKLNIQSEIEIIDAEIMNHLGQSVIVFAQKYLFNDIDVSSLINGVYFLRVRTSEGAKVIKIVKR